jgi:hypothetical protein
MYTYGLKKTRSIWLVDVNLLKLCTKQSMIMEIKGHSRITLLIQPPCYGQLRIFFKNNENHWIPTINHDRGTLFKFMKTSQIHYSKLCLITIPYMHLLPFLDDDIVSKILKNIKCCKNKRKSKWMVSLFLGFDFIKFRMLKMCSSSIDPIT